LRTPIDTSIVASFAFTHRHTHAGTRRGRSLASGLESLVRDSRRPRKYFTAAAPFRYDTVRDAAPELLELAALLRTTEHPSHEGLALARHLLVDPCGPVYFDCGEDLRARALEARNALEEDRA
jgi:hypothetical protein